MSDWAITLFYAIFGLFAGVGLVTFLIAVVRRTMDWRESRQAYEEPKLDLRSLFCRDCGKKYVIKSSQDGFDSKTGQPLYEHRLRCPDYGKKPKVSASGAASMPMYYGLFMTHTDYRNCGARVSNSAVVHDHTESVSLDCPTCVGDMFINGALDQNTARKHLAKAGVQ